MKRRIYTVLIKQFVVVCIGVFMIMELRNLIQITCTEYIEGSSQQTWKKLIKYKCETTNEDWSWSIRQQLKYKYSKQDLLDIANMVISCSTYKWMDTGLIRRIRKLRLNQRGKWGGVRINSHLEVYRCRQNGANKKNLVNVEITKNRPKALKTSNTRLALVNARSIKNKDLMLHHHLIEKDIDICLVTETWLGQTDIDKIWYESTVLNRNQFQLFPSNSQGWWGGGIALVTKTNITTKLLDEGQLKTFQFAKWQVAVSHTSITVIALYHPPPSNLMRVTNGEFLDEFTDWAAESVSTCNNVILVGDFKSSYKQP